MKGQQGPRRMITHGALMFQEHDGALSDYCAKRLDLIAMYVDSMSEDA